MTYVELHIQDFRLYGQESPDTWCSQFRPQVITQQIIFQSTV
jgi:hypothetical protein